MNESTDHALNDEFGGGIRESGHEIVRRLLIGLEVRELLHSHVHGLGGVGKVVLEGVHAIGHRELGLINSAVRGKRKGYPFAMEVK